MFSNSSVGSGGEACGQIRMISVASYSFLCTQFCWGLILRRSSLIKPDDSLHCCVLTLVFFLQNEVEDPTRDGGGGGLFAIAAKLHKDNHCSLAFHFRGKLSVRQRGMQRRKNKTPCNIPPHWNYKRWVLKLELCQITFLSTSVLCLLALLFSFPIVYLAAFITSHLIVLLAALPRLSNTPGRLLRRGKFQESAVLNLFNLDNKNILIAQIEMRGNHAHRCVS